MFLFPFLITLFWVGFSLSGYFIIKHSSDEHLLNILKEKSIPEMCYNSNNHKTK